MWVNGWLYLAVNGFLVGQSLARIDVRSSTYTFWCKTDDADFDTGCRDAKTAQQIVMVALRLEGRI